jgi:hypothetical protein
MEQMRNAHTLVVKPEWNKPFCRPRITLKWLLKKQTVDWIFLA